MNIRNALNCLGFLIVLLLLENNIFYDTIKKRKKGLNVKIKKIWNNFYYQTSNVTLTKNKNCVNLEETYQEIKKSFILKDFCSLVPKNLVGNFTIKKTPFNFKNPFSYQTYTNSDEVEFAKYLSIGGMFVPQNCLPRHRIAFVIPYKNRLDNLNQFLLNMHPFLQRQELAYTIFVVEQANDQLFNKGILMNSAYIEIKKNYDNYFQCILFHDVDLIPSVGPHNYLIKYPILVGGVLIFRFEHFQKVNGYSNVYWGWGAEDDDMYYRLQYSGVGFERPARNSVYRTLDHEPRYKNPKRVELLQKSLSRYKQDGVNSVNYTLLSIIKYPLLTHIKIDVGIMPKGL